MGTQVLLIAAAPTPWDVEGRLAGQTSLPLTAEAVDAIGHLVKTLPKVDSIYRPAANAACDQTARMIACRFELRPRDNPDLDGPNLGLWQGLTENEIEARYPTVYPQWKENPLVITPPDGEALSDVIARVHSALQRILRRNRDSTVALAVRPRILQIVTGILHGQDEGTIASHLHVLQPLETIVLPATS